MLNSCFSLVKQKWMSVPCTLLVFMLVSAVMFTSCGNTTDPGWEARYENAEDGKDELQWNWVMMEGLYLYQDSLKSYADYFGEISPVERVSASHTAEISNFYDNDGDRFTRYFDPAYGDAVRSAIFSSPVSAGIGVVLALPPDSATPMIVERVAPDSPADRAGLLAGDTLVEFTGGSGAQYYYDTTASRVLMISAGGDTLQGSDWDDYATDDWSPFYELGDPVNLGVLRNDSILEFQATTANITWPTVWLDTSNAVPVLLVEGFQQVTSNPEGTAAEFLAFMDDLNRDTIIIDLRGNGGGLVNQSNEIVEYFVHEDEFLLRRVERWPEFRGQPAFFDTTDYYGQSNTDGGEEMTVVVLLDDGSASASEMLAMSLRNARGCEIIGTQSYGKAIGQIVLDSPRGGIALITNFQHYAPDGSSWQETGLTPDIVIGDGEDALEVALDYLSGGSLAKLGEPESLAKTGVVSQALNKTDLAVRAHVQSSFSIISSPKLRTMIPGLSASEIDDLRNGAWIRADEHAGAKELLENWKK